MIEQQARSSGFNRYVRMARIFGVVALSGATVLSACATPADKSGVLIVAEPESTKPPTAYHEVMSTIVPNCFAPNWDALLQNSCPGGDDLCRADNAAARVASRLRTLYSRSGSPVQGSSFESE